MSNAFDFSAALNAAQGVVDKTGNSNDSNYKYPLIYPAQGSTLTVRPLFNPASGQIVRLVNRHEKTPCYRTYNIECPICKVMEEVKSITGQDPFGRGKASRARGICFAQFVSSTTAITKADGSNIQPGEIVLLMFPYTVYTALSATIQAAGQTPTGMDQAFCHANQGMFIQIQRGNDNKYTTTPSPYMTTNFPMTDDEFMKMLEGMESLNDQVLPSEITEEVDKQVREYADAIYREYVVPRTPSQGVPQGTAPMNAAQIVQGGQAAPVGYPSQTSQATPQYSTTVATNGPANYQQPGTTAQAPQYTPQPAPQVAPQAPVSDTPQCYGHHVMMSPQCLVCPAEAKCQEATMNNQ